MLYLTFALFFFIMALNYAERTKLDASNNAQIIKIVFFILVVLIGLSKDLGGDIITSYGPDFKYAPKLTDLTWNYIFNPEEYATESSKFQPLYIITRSFIRSLSSEFWVYQLIHAFFINVVIFSFLKKRALNICMAILFYLFFNFFEYNMEIIRESLAIACGLLAFNQYEKKRYPRFVIWLIAAYLFHSSALILLILPLCALLTNIPSKKFNVLFVIAIVLLFMFYQHIDFLQYVDVLDEKDASLASEYLSQNISKGLNINSYLLYIVQFLIAPLVIIFLTRKENTYKYWGLLYAYLFFRMLGLNSTLFYRCANYFAPFYWLFLANSALSLSAKYSYKSRKLVLSLFVLFYFVLALQVMLMKEVSSNSLRYERYIPYKSVLF